MATIQNQLILFECNMPQAAKVYVYVDKINQTAIAFADYTELANEIFRPLYWVKSRLPYYEDKDIMIIKAERVKSKRGGRK